MINTKKLLYFAYGTNLNKKIFLKKYKDAKYLSKHILKGFELVFRSKYRVPDIQRKKGSSVKGIIYEIDKATEKKLDRYEDYPKLYIKKFFYKNSKSVMYYFMKRKTHTVKPGRYYLEVMKSGYQLINFNFNFKYLSEK